MFSTSMAEKNQEEIELQCIDSVTFKSVIDFMYSGDIDILNDNVQDLFSTASLLQMTELCALCCVHMAREIHTSNCVNLFRFASAHHSEQLKKVAKSYIVDHFTEINETEDFLQLDIDEISEILQEDDLNVCDEFLVLSTVMQWLNRDPEKRLGIVDLLLKYIRFTLLDDTVLDDLLQSLETYKNGAVLSRCMNEIQKVCDKESTSLRLGMYEREMIVFAGGSQSKHTRSFAAFDPSTKRNYYAVQPYLSFDFKYRIDHHRVVVTEKNQVFLIGGVFYEVLHFENSGLASDDFRCFNPYRKKWESKPKLPYPICAHAAVTSVDKVFVIGGKSTYPVGDPSDHVSVYHAVEEDHWESLCPLPTALCHHGAVVYDNTVIVIGGYTDGANSIVNQDIFQYDITSNQWRKLDVRLNCPRAEFGIAKMTQNIYVIGGDNGTFKVSMVEVLSLTDMKVTFVADFPEDRKSMNAVCYNNAVYVCGGVRTIISRLNRGPRVVEARDMWKYTAESNHWQKEAKLVQYANIHGCCVAKVNLRRMFESDFVSSA